LREGREDGEVLPLHLILLMMCYFIGVVLGKKSGNFSGVL
jgi:hypothetical protein